LSSDNCNLWCSILAAYHRSRSHYNGLDCAVFYVPTNTV